MRRLLAAVSALIIIGCAASRPPETASGKAEVIIPRGEQQRFTDVLVKNASEREYSVLEVTAYKAAFEKSGNFGMSLAYGEGSRRRLAFDFVPAGDSLRVVGRLEAVGARGNIEATRTGQDIYEFLMKTMAEFNAGPSSAPILK